VDPPDEAVVGSRVVFRLVYRGIDDAELRDARFRIELRGRNDDDASIEFDQRRHKRGWTAGSPGEMLYRPRRPIPDGEYVWSVGVWDGVVWRGDETRFRLRVDSVPPAPVENLRVRYVADRNVLRLDWDPVATDVEGGAEYVAAYHVYRYSRADNTPSAEPFEVIRTETPATEIPVAGPLEARLWFFRVTAEDLAGNEADRAR